MMILCIFGRAEKRKTLFSISISQYMYIIKEKTTQDETKQKKTKGKMSIDKEDEGGRERGHHHNGQKMWMNKISGWN